MSAKQKKLIFELTASEREHRFKTVLDDVLLKAVTLNQPMVYRNEFCIKPNLFVHQYPDGRKELIEQDSKDSSEKLVRVLD